MAIRLRKKGPADVSIMLYGVLIKLTGETPELLGQMQDVLPPVWIPADPTSECDLSLGMIASESDDQDELVLRQELPDVETGWLEINHGPSAEMLDQLRRTLRDFVARNAPAHVFLHAGVVAHHGRALLLPGESFAGKSTLTAALARAGAEYYSDDFAVLSPDGIVHPFPEPVSLRLTFGRFAQTPHTMAELGAVAGTKPVPVGLIVASQYRPGRTWDPVTLSPAAAVLELITHTYQCTDRPELSMHTLHNAISGARMLKGERGEAEELAPILLAELEAQSAGAVDQAAGATDQVAAPQN